MKDTRGTVEESEDLWEITQEHMTSLPVGDQLSNSGWIPRSWVQHTRAGESHFPRHQIGESLLPSMMPILSDLGLSEKVEAENFPKKTGDVHLGKEQGPMVCTLQHQPFLPHAYAYHVDRAKFDKILLDNSRELAQMFAKAKSPIVDEDGRVIGGFRVR